MGLGKQVTISLYLMGPQVLQQEGLRPQSRCHYVLCWGGRGLHLGSKPYSATSWPCDLE